VKSASEIRRVNEPLFTFQGKNFGLSGQQPILIFSQSLNPSKAVLSHQAAFSSKQGHIKHLSCLFMKTHLLFYFIFFQFLCDLLELNAISASEIVHVNEPTFTFEENFGLSGQQSILIFSQSLNPLKAVLSHQAAISSKRGHTQHLSCLFMKTRLLFYLIFIFFNFCVICLNLMRNWPLKSDV
jgi:hypothetical protein